MSKKLYVGNLPFSSTEEELKELFAQHGEVTSVAIITDRETGRSKGFGFVEFAQSEDADKAIKLDNSEFGGRNLKVSEAKEREPRSGGYRGGSDRGGRDGGRGGYRDRDRR